MIYNNIEDMVGNTPLLRINGDRYGIKNVDLYVKCEFMNPFGSIKDRTALQLIKDIDFDEMRNNDTKLIESSSGNTAKALQMLAHRNSVGMVSVTNMIKVPEVNGMLKYLGTEIVSLPGRSECPDPNDPDNAVATIERMVHKDPEKYYHTSQFTNPKNPHAHEIGTAVELFDDLDTIDYFVTGVGTGGSSGGVIDYIDKQQLPTKAIGVVADPSDFLPGIRTRTELFETPLFKEDRYETLAEVTSKNALEALDKLVRNEGVMCGPTTGANFAVALDWARQHDELRHDGSRPNLVFIACDRLEPYVSYLQKRLPERFGISGHTDVYALEDPGAEVDISIADFETQLASETPPLVIDTRSIKAYELFHINHSVCYPEETLHALFEDGSPFLGQTIIFVCPRGDRSRLYANLVRQRGGDAYSLEGGLGAWRRAGKPLVKRQTVKG